MRILLIFISYMFFVTPFSYALDIDHEVKGVTIFLDRAEVNRKAIISLKTGEHELIFSSLSSQIDANTIRVGGSGNLVILNTYFRPNYLDQNQLPKSLLRVKDSIALYERKVSRLANLISSLKAEEDLLKSNKLISSEQGLTVQELRSMSVFYKERLESISNEIFDVAQEKSNLQQILTNLRKQYSNRTAFLNQQQGEIVVNVLATQITSAEMNISYTTLGAGWYPSYNLRSDGQTKEVELEQFAVVYQNTGEEWTNVSLSLSTQNTSSSNKPNLYPWYLDIRNEYLKKSRVAPSRAMPLSMEQEAVMMDELTESIQHTSDYVEKLNSVLSVTYALDLKYTLLNGTRDKRISISQNRLPATYQHFAIPKLSDHVFLTAGVNDWSQLDLLPGEVNVFLSGAYVGQSFLDPATMDERIEVSLGVDPAILADRKVLIDYINDQSIGNNRKRTFAYEITLKNMKKSEVIVRLLDQVPISKNDDIAVSIEELSSGKLNNKTGIITWDKKLPAQSSDNLKLIYEVKYPKGQRLNGL